MQACHRMTLSGYTRTMILDYANEKVRDSYEFDGTPEEQGKRQLNRAVWDVADRQIDSSIAGAKKLILEQARIEADEQFALADGRFNMLFRDSYRTQDYKGAAFIEKARVELHGLNRQVKADPAATGAAAAIGAMVTMDEWRKQADTRISNAEMTLADIGMALDESPAT